jgi:hypothetical protein
MDRIYIQAQDYSGNWSTYNVTENVPLLIIQNMRHLQWQFPDRRIRAIDDNGRLVDIL